MEFFIWLAILPSIIIAFIINRADQKEKEPKIELVKAFSMGFLSVVLTLLLSSLLGVNHIRVRSDHIIEVALYSFFAIAFIEEFCKWICAHLFLRKNKNFNYLFDGILYVTLVSLGFATIENILYTLQGGLTTVIVRAITTVPAHAFFGIASGYYYSLSKKEKVENHSKKSTQYFVISFLLPFLLHGFYDFCLLTENMILFTIYLIFIVSLYSISTYQVKKFMTMDSPFIKKRKQNK